jgi:putative sigma-54 modulation protein
MRVNVRFMGFASSDYLAEHVTRKAHQHLSRFGHRVDAVEARLSDVNGPRGGRDKRCRLTVHVLGAPPVHVEELHQDLYAAIDLALARGAQAVGRSIERARQHHPAARERRAS